jgi:hypothetical protein
MFGQSKPIPFEPYGRRRKRARMPRWLVLLLLGTAIGVAGVVLVQERYLPPRLSASESATLRNELAQADAERQKLRSDLAAATKQRDTALADAKRQADELAASRATSERLREDLTSVIASLPPDPRGGGVAVRAGRFVAKDGMLAYDVVLTRERGAGKPMNGVMQLVVAGESARGGETTATLKPVAVSIAGKSLGMRVMLVG